MITLLVPVSYTHLDVYKRQVVGCRAHTHCKAGCNLHGATTVSLNVADNTVCDKTAADWSHAVCVFTPSAIALSTLCN